MHYWVEVFCLNNDEIESTDFIFLAESPVFAVQKSRFIPNDRTICASDVASAPTDRYLDWINNRK